MAHEITEQVAKQRDGEEYNEAHKKGVEAENRVNGSKRVDVEGFAPTSGGGRARLRYEKDGTVRTVSFQKNKNNVENVKEEN